MVEILDAISHKLFGQYDRFTAWFGTVLIERFTDVNLSLKQHGSAARHLKIKIEKNSIKSFN